MVWCPIHNKYLNGRNSKTSHAYDKDKPCRWMKNYLLKTQKTVGKNHENRT